ncbi:hypothetical protein ACPOM7_18155 [Peribacillus castrilensis]|uniref:hypothetical protein n=1 Tax=Bacillaceae TaxID=186817 RepID=UPI001140C0ED|nr:MULTISPECIES: hypothetical protein [Bacillaceae]MCF7621948.1 hypothetical protein [Peribacillus frigoritolerans]MCP1156065.1 hypothetical protein [Peribacillus frigoritolerans]
MFKRGFKEIEEGRNEKINSLPKANKGTPVSNAFITSSGVRSIPTPITGTRLWMSDCYHHRLIRSKSRRQKYGDNPGPGPLTCPLIATTFLPW